MQNNIGTVDRYIRLTAGLLALGTGSTMKRPTMTRTLLMSFGAMKVAEGVTGWCPIIYMTERVSTSSQQGASTQHSTSAQSSQHSTSAQSSQHSMSSGSEGFSRAQGSSQQSSPDHRTSTDTQSQQTSTTRSAKATQKTSTAPAADDPSSHAGSHTHDGRTHKPDIAPTLQ